MLFFKILWLISFLSVTALFLFQDIVTDSSSFDLVGFMPLLRERIGSKNPFTRQFIISWVKFVK